MTPDTPRLRMFAGPNGSGKSVLKSYLPQPLLGVYLNADEIEAGANQCGYVEMTSFGIETTAAEMLPMLTSSSFLMKEGFSEAAKRVTFEQGRLNFPAGVINSYFASVVA